MKTKAANNARLIGLLTQAKEFTGVNDEVELITMALEEFINIQRTELAWSLFGDLTPAPKKPIISSRMEEEIYA